MHFLFYYSIGLSLGIQLGKGISPTRKYLLDKYSVANVDYYRNNQMTIRFNK